MSAHRRKPDEVDVVCYMRTVRGNHIGVWAGKLETHHTPDGAPYTREVFIWLPRSQAFWKHLDGGKTGRVRVRLPRWLALDRGLVLPDEAWQAGGEEAATG